MTTWPSGLRRVTRNHFSSGGVGSNPAVVAFYTCLFRQTISSKQKYTKKTKQTISKNKKQKTKNIQKIKPFHPDLIKIL